MRFNLVLSTLLACTLCGLTVNAEDAAALLKIIRAPDTADVDRANAFEKIGDIAGQDAVETLVGFLGDEKWSHYARFALQKMDGEPVTRALLESLESLQGDLKLGVIGTIGRRRDPIAIVPLTHLLADADAETAGAAATALGWIGTADAAAALTKALDTQADAKRRESLGSALLLVGQRLAKTGDTETAIEVFDLLRKSDLSKACRIGATQAAILVRGAQGVDLMAEQLRSSDLDFFQIGLASARVLPGEQGTKRLTATLVAEPSPERQVLLIQAIKDRGDRRALPFVIAKLESDSPAVRLAAIRAIGSLGDAASIAPLLSSVSETTEEAVLDSLVMLQGTGVNAALTAAAKQPETSVLAIDALGKRRATESVDLLFQLAESDRPDVSQAAIAALGTTAPQERFRDLLAMLKTAKTGARKAAIQQAIHGAVFRSTDPDACADSLCDMIPSVTGADRDYLFEQVRIAGGATAIARMREFATGRDESLQDAATKTLGLWLSADAAPVLLEVAQGGGKFANRALAGYIRIFRQFELPETERVTMAEKALGVATRASERNAAIDAMTRFPCVGTFDLALKQLEASGSETAAAKAVLTIARIVLDLDPEKGKAGLQRLIDANVAPDVTRSAKALLQKALSR